MVRPRTGCMKVGAMLHEDIGDQCCFTSEIIRLTPLEDATRILFHALVERNLEFSLGKVFDIIRPKPIKLDVEICYP